MTPERWHIPTCDEELVDVFLEEVGELLRSIDEHLKRWTAKPKDQQSLIQIRRCFHTIKGSGRMVKALDLSEVAWKVERMLNQALGGAVPVSEPMVKVVSAVRAQIPHMLEAFRNRRSLAGNRDVETLMRLADTLAAGTPSASAPTLRSVHTREDGRAVRSEVIGARLERCMQRADEALHRSEMALQLARQASDRVESSQKGVASAAELARLGELVRRLSNEVYGQRRVAPRSGTALQDPRDLGAKIPARRFGWPALILSGLAGALGAVAVMLSIQQMP